MDKFDTPKTLQRDVATGGGKAIERSTDVRPTDGHDMIPAEPEKTAIKRFVVCPRLSDRQLSEFRKALRARIANASSAFGARRPVPVEVDGRVVYGLVHEVAKAREELSPKISWMQLIQGAALIWVIVHVMSMLMAWVVAAISL